MGLITKLKEVIDKMFGRQEVTKPYNVTADLDAKMYEAIKEWDNLFTCTSTNIAGIIASEAARLATIDMSITCENKGNGKKIEDLLNANKDKLRSKLELGCAYGGLILKPNGVNGIDFIPSSRFLPISFDGNGNIDSVIFIDTYTSQGKFYTRLEYHHRDEEGHYIIENKAFQSVNKLKLGYEIDLSASRWKNLIRFVALDNVEKPLFGYFRTPMANNIDIDSPLGVSIYARAVESIKDFENAYKKWKREINTSDKVVFVDESAMLKAQENGGKATVCNPMPEVVKGLRMGNNVSSCIEEYNPNIRVDDFKKVLQTQLDLISIQCGFSSGYLSFDEKTGAITATQVISDNQKTYSTCTDIQQNYKQALEGLIWALDKTMQLYEERGKEEFAISFYLRDLFVNVEEDRNRAYQLAQNGYIPKWKYLVDYEGYSKEEAKEMVKLAQQEGNAKTE